VTRPARQIEPVVMAELSAVHLKAAVEVRDGNPVLVIQDGVVAVEVRLDTGSGMAGSYGLERLQTAAGMFADLLRRRS
jgi:hypothetical protein